MQRRNVLIGGLLAPTDSSVSARVNSELMQQRESPSRAKEGAQTGYDSVTAQAVLDSVRPMQDFAALRDYTGGASGVRVTGRGIAGPFYVDPSDVSSADNSGTIIVDASGRRWKRDFTGPLRPEMFGANGGPNDAAAFNAALTVSGALLLADGATYTFTTGLKRTGSIWLMGNARLVFNFSGAPGLTCVGSAGQVARFVDIIFDAGSAQGRTRAVALEIAGYDSVVFTRTSGTRQHNTNTSTTRFVNMVNCFDAVVEGGSYSDITALGDGSVGNGQGAVRAIYATGDRHLGMVHVHSGTLFENIHTVSSEGMPIVEDADAVVVQNVGAFKHDAWVDRCRFRNVGKRGLKSQANGDSLTMFTGNTVDSAWTVSNPDSMTNNGMYAMVSAYGGNLVTRDNYVSGPICYFEESVNCKSVSSSGNVHVGGYVNGVVNNLTRPYHHTNISESFLCFGNRRNSAVAGYASGAAAGAFDAIAAANSFTSRASSMEFVHARHLVVAANVLRATDSGGPSIRMHQSIGSFAGVGCVMTGFQDGYYFDASIPVAFSNAIVGNTFDVSRNPVSNFAPFSAQHQATSGNMRNTPHSGMVAAKLSQTTGQVGPSGSSAALPLQPALYEVVRVNGIVYHRPLYNASA